MSVCEARRLSFPSCESPPRFRQVLPGSRRGARGRRPAKPDAPHEFARRLPAPAQKGSEFIALVLGQGHAITYIHGHLLFGGAVEFDK